MKNIKHYIAVFLNFIGVKPNVSSDICGETTYGYGKLDSNGYWNFLLNIK